LAKEKAEGLQTRLRRNVAQGFNRRVCPAESEAQRLGDIATITSMKNKYRFWKQAIKDEEAIENGERRGAERRLTNSTGHRVVGPNR